MGAIPWKQPLTKPPLVVPSLGAGELALTRADGTTFKAQVVTTTVRAHGNPDGPQDCELTLELLGGSIVEDAATTKPPPLQPGIVREGEVPKRRCAAPSYRSEHCENAASPGSTYCRSCLESNDYPSWCRRCKDGRGSEQCLTCILEGPMCLACNEYSEVCKCRKSSLLLPQWLHNYDWSDLWFVGAWLAACWALRGLV